MHSPGSEPRALIFNASERKIPWLSQHIIKKAQKNISEQLRFLLELDELSPLNVDRKKEIATILSRDLGQEQEAKKYFTESP
jgi:hypothetical protein